MFQLHLVIPESLVEQVESLEEPVVIDAPQLLVQALLDAICAEFNELPPGRYGLSIGDVALAPDQALAAQTHQNAKLTLVALPEPIYGTLHASNGEVFNLNRPSIWVGRPDPRSGQQIDIDLTSLDPEHSTSRPHARFLQDEDKYYLQALRTKNETSVNGEKLATDERRQLQDGDELRLGDVLLSFRLQTET